MNDDQLKDYISKTKAAGYTDEQIKQALKNGGWSDEDIDKALGLKQGLPEVPDELMLTSDQGAKKADEEPVKEDPGVPDNQQASENKGENPSTNTLAILSLIMAFLMPILGLILGFIALRQIKKKNEKGKGLAVAGVVISSIFMLIALISVVLFFVGMASFMNFTNSVPDYCKGSPGIDCLELPVADGQGITFALTNNMGGDIILQELDSYACSDSAAVALSSSSNDFTEVNDQYTPTIHNGDVFKIRLGCSLETGQKVADSVTLRLYDQSQENTVYSQVTLRGTVQ